METKTGTGARRRAIFLDAIASFDGSIDFICCLASSPKTTRAGLRGSCASLTTLWRQSHEPTARYTKNGLR